MRAGLAQELLVYEHLRGGQLFTLSPLRSTKACRKAGRPGTRLPLVYLWTAVTRLGGVSCACIVDITKQAMVRANVLRTILCIDSVRPTSLSRTPYPESWNNGRSVARRRDVTRPLVSARCVEPR